MPVSALHSPSSLSWPLERLKRWLSGLREASPRSAPLVARRVNPADIGRGFADPGHPGMKRIVVTVDAATFDRIRDLSLRSEISLAAAVRLLVERGFAAAAETP